MKRKLMCALMALMLLGAMPGTCRGGEMGSMRVSLNRENQENRGGSVTIYRAGTPISGGYRLTEAFGGGVVAWEDVYSVALAAWLAEQAKFGGTELLLDAQGCADFTGLSEGLYLLVQQTPTPGYCPMEPFLVELPYEGQWDLQANLISESLPEVIPQTGQSILPILAALTLPYTGLAVALLVRKRRKYERRDVRDEI